jgi:hypothetical protein
MSARARFSPHMLHSLPNGRAAAGFSPIVVASIFADSVGW